MHIIKLAVPLLAALAYAPQASAVPVLGPQLASFAVLGASAVTNTGATVLNGNLGVSNNSSQSGITGFFGTLANDGPGIAAGAVHQGDAYATVADGQLVNAITSLGLMGPGTGLGVNLVGLTLAPGVYTVLEGTSNLTGMLTLDGGGNANAFWVFQMQGTLITSPGSFVNVINTGQGAGVYWNVASSATLDTSTTFMGNILAGTSITMNNGVTLACGRALAHTGAVTMISDTVNATGCLGQGLSGGLSVLEAGGIPVPLPFASAVPEPGSLPMLSVGLAGLVIFRRKSVQRLFGGLTSRSQ